MTPITIVGNLTDDPELRFTPSGAALVKFAVAVNRRTFDRAKNEWTDAGTDFH
ncbi:single-stranded DNA-binding protein, partial [Streptomyces sp. MBT67]|uniref:single-stranded DNA-binding protein n=1 Tax=Streptomyces sp. MBT67 TaxID=1488397 RepID=UPI00190AF165